VHHDGRRLSALPVGRQRRGYHPLMTARRILPIGFVAALLALVACTSSGSSGSPTAATPTPAELLASSSTAMAEVSSAHFALTVAGDLPSITVQQAQGDLTAAGDAKGTASIVQFGQLIEAEFVLVGGQLYLKGPTGGFNQVPAALAGSVYDPAAILNPDKGVAKVLGSVTNPAITGTDGSDWVVTGTVPAEVAGGLVPGLNTDVDGQFTIAMSGAQLSGAVFTLDGADGQPATVTVDLSELNTPVSITAPG
jgi:lipoprotein LprG